MESKKLSETASISSGVFVKAKSQNLGIEEPNVVYVQASDVKDGALDLRELKPNVCMTKEDQDKLDKHEHILEDGDVLLIAKGTPRAVVYKTDDEKLVAVASTAFVVIRISESDRDRVSSEYLCWWLNSSYARRFYQVSSAGVLPIKRLQDLEINIPTLEYQERFIKAVNAFKEQYLIKREMLEKERELGIAKLEELVGMYR